MNLLGVKYADLHFKSNNVTKNVLLNSQNGTHSIATIFAHNTQNIA